ncbi:hypothetical protein KSP40_PGU011402 [Platanthera guangdongensis]|uniref:Uncharacterized protein n=1 Tax=Platanthera guangdongensis TaxID=2320717 RepID=A0ABR2M0K6_9ASPA
MVVRVRYRRTSGAPSCSPTPTTKEGSPPPTHAHTRAFPPLRQYPSSTFEDYRHSKSAETCIRKVSFSTEVEEFPLTQSSHKDFSSVKSAHPRKHTPEEEKLIWGKRYTPEEDELIRKAIMDYIEEIYKAIESTSFHQPLSTPESLLRRVSELPSIKISYQRLWSVVLRFRQKEFSRRLYHVVICLPELQDVMMRLVLGEAKMDHHFGRETNILAHFPSEDDGLHAPEMVAEIVCMDTSTSTARVGHRDAMVEPPSLIESSLSLDLNPKENFNLSNSIHSTIEFYHHCFGNCQVGKEESLWTLANHREDGEFLRISDNSCKCPDATKVHREESTSFASV